MNNSVNDSQQALPSRLRRCEIDACQDGYIRLYRPREQIGCHVDAEIKEIVKKTIDEIIEKAIQENNALRKIRNKAND